MRHYPRVTFPCKDHSQRSHGTNNTNTAFSAYTLNIVHKVFELMFIFLVNWSHDHQIFKHTYFLKSTIMLS